MELFGYTAETFVAAHRLVLASACTRTTAPRRRRRSPSAIESLRRLRGRLPRRARRRHGALGRGPRPRAVRRRRAGRPGCSARPTTRPRSTAPPSASGRVLETMSTAFFTLDLDWRFTYVNGAAERMLGRRRDELVGTPIWDVLPELEGHARPAPTTGSALATGEPSSFEHYYPPLDAWFDVRATPSEDGLSASTSTTSPAGCAPSRTRRGSPASARMRSPPAARRPAACRSSARAGARLAGTLEVDELLQILSDVDPQRLRRRASWWRSRSGSSATWRARRRRRPAAAASASRTSPASTTPLHGSPIPAAALAAGAVQDREARELDERLGSRPALTLPLVSRGPHARRDHRARTRSRARSTGAC